MRRSIVKPQTATTHSQLTILQIQLGSLHSSVNDVIYGVGNMTAEGVDISWWSFVVLLSVCEFGRQLQESHVGFHILWSINGKKEHYMNSMQTCNSVTFYFMKKLIF